MAAANMSVDPEYAASVEVLYPNSQRDFDEFNEFLDDYVSLMQGAGYHDEISTKLYYMSIDGLIASLKKKVNKFLTEKKKRKKRKKRKLTSKPSSETSLRDWFGRRGAKGKKKGWVDCNAPDGKGGYKSCGRSSGEKRKRYPACRPTPGACKKMKGSKGKSWGKKDSKRRGKKK